MTASDCYEIGIETYKNKNYYHSEQWLNEAYNRLAVNSKESNKLKLPILIKLSNVHKKLSTTTTIKIKFPICVINSN